MSIFRFCYFAIFIFFVSGCASGYKQYYKTADGMDPILISRIRSDPFSGSTIVQNRNFDNIEIALSEYEKKGYTVIGSSIFNSGRSESEDDAIKQAIAVQADLVVILDPSYTGSVTTNVPLTTPTSSTSYSTGSATAHGPNGPVSVYGSSATTTYGTETTYMPVTVHRQNYGAIYFIKQKYMLGIYIRDLSDKEKQMIQSNKGIVIRSVVEDTPAYNADLLSGDILISVDGFQISNQNSFDKLLAPRAGKKINISLLRNGELMNKDVKLN